MSTNGLDTTPHKPVKLERSGTRVEAHSLQGAVGLNGLQGIVKGSQGDRVVVDFGQPHGRKALKPANLTIRHAIPQEPVPKKRQMPEGTQESNASVKSRRSDAQSIEGLLFQQGTVGSATLTALQSTNQATIPEIVSTINSLGLYKQTLNVKQVQRAIVGLETPRGDGGRTSGRGLVDVLDR